MPPPLPPEEITELMRFIAEKTKNVTSPMNVRELSRQFKGENGSSATVNTLKRRIDTHRLKIHGMTEFDTETKVKMLFALSSPINAGFLIKLKKVADVKVDDKQRIIHYKQKDGELELSAKNLRVTMDQGEDRNQSILQFLAEKAETTNKSIADRALLREFKEKSGYTDSIEALIMRYRRVKNTIYQSSEINKNTKIKMIFVSNAKLPDDVLAELRKDANVEVDEERRITKYKSNDGSLELKGSHGKSSITKSFYSDRWHTICEKIYEVVSEQDDEEDVNWQEDYERKRINLVRFLIERTKNATSPLSLYKLAKDYKTEFKSSEPLDTTMQRIKSFRQRIHEINQFDISTKVKLIFSLSSSIDAKFLKELQKEATVEVNENQRIEKYKANDGSLELEGYHSQSAKAKARSAEMKKKRVVKDSSDSEDDRDEEDSSESDESEKEEDGENVGESMRSKQFPPSLSAKRSDRLQKSRISFRNSNKKRQLPEQDSDLAQTRNSPATSARRKKAKISYSSSKASEDDPSAREDDDEESEKSEDDSSMINEDNNVDNFGDDFDYDPPINNNYDENLEHNVTNSNSERNIATPEVTDAVEEEKKKEEGSSASSSAKIESMSLLELLNHLRSPIAQYTPTLILRIDENIEKLEEKDRQIPFNIIIESLESCIQILNTPDEMDSDENTTSLCDFFYRIERAMHNITHSMMNDLQLKIENLAWADDTKVSFGHIRYAMGKTIDKILH